MVPCLFVMKMNELENLILGSIKELVHTLAIGIEV